MDFNNSKWLKKTTHEDPFMIQTTQVTVLFKGLNLAIASEKLPVVDFITSTESACKGLASDKASELRATINSIICKPTDLEVNTTLK